VKRFIITLYAIFFLHSFGNAQWLTSPDFDKHTQQGIDFVYNLQFDKADSEFRELTVSYPHHPAGYFFLAMVDWWRILLNIDSDSLDDGFFSKLDVVIHMCDSLLDKNPDDVTALFFKGGALGFRGRLHADRDDWLRAANDGRLALPIVQRAFKIAPDNYDVLLGMGIYNYYAEVIPEEYPEVKPLMVFFPSGDKQKGIEQLTMAGEHAKYASVEAKYFLLQIYYSYENDYQKAYRLAQDLSTRFPLNAVFQRYLGRCEIGLGLWEEAHSTFLSILDRSETKTQSRPGYSESAAREALYYLGLYDMNVNNLDDALKYFYHCDELCRSLDKNGGSGFMAMTNLKIGMIFDLQHKREYALLQYKKVLRLDEYQKSHELADQYIKNPFTQ
jgi:tetratricopeptide (TPR) repeat protein